MKLSLSEIFAKGIFPENPVIRGLVGLCPLLALSSSVAEAAAIATALLGVLVFCSLVVSFFRSLIGPQHRLGVFILTAAVGTALAQTLFQLFWRGMDLGVFLPLLAVNEIVLGRAGAFARQRPVGQSVVDALGMGLGFALVILLLAVLREGLGQGRVWGVPLLGAKWAQHAVAGIALPFGAFLTAGVSLGILRRFRRHD